MTEIRHDTQPMSREDIDAALDAHQRETLPLPVALDIADANGLDVVVCPACRGGLVNADVATQIAIAIDLDDEEPITVVEPQ